MNFHQVEIMWHGVIYLLLWSSSLLSYPSPYFSCLSLLLLSSYLLTQDYFPPSQDQFELSCVREDTSLPVERFQFFVLFLKAKHLIIEGYLFENRLFVLRLKRCHKNLWISFCRVSLLLSRCGTAKRCSNPQNKMWNFSIWCNAASIKDCTQPEFVISVRCNRLQV